jgi:ribosomal protein S14
MITLKIKDQNNRFRYKILEKQKLVLKSVIHNENIDEKVRINAYLKLQKLDFNSSISRLKNRCVLTNRSRAVYRKFKISRLVFRRLAVSGKLSGVKKAS